MTSDININSNVWLGYK